MLFYCATISDWRNNMKTRQEIKSLAKAAITSQRGASILILLLVMLVTSLVVSVITFVSIFATGFVIGAFAMVFIIFMPFIIIAVSVAVSIFTYTLQVNMYGSYLKIYEWDRVELSDPFTALNVNFLRKAGGMFWMILWIFLWALLLYIPGIIKAFAYSMTPFILADCPDVTATQALKLSMRITEGHKGKLFVALLSFIGWAMLVPFTFGILGIVYVGPYMYTTYAGFYAELRDLAIAEGRISKSDLYKGEFKGKSAVSLDKNN